MTCSGWVDQSWSMSAGWLKEASQGTVNKEISKCPHVWE